MKTPFLSFVCLLSFASTPLRAADEPGTNFKPLFNGTNLSGWVPVNVAPRTFTVRDGMIVSTGKPTGILRTDRQYENFILELEWKHIQPKGNAGVFIWSEPMTAPGTPFAKSIEVQILDVAAGNLDGSYTGHGDVFSIHGARMVPDRPHPGGWERCLPSESRANPAGQWNHYRIEARDGVLKLAVNGKVVSGASGCNPRKGYICLESEGSECHFRQLRIVELPSSNPSAAQTVSPAQSWLSLYSGIDLSGWQIQPETSRHWQARDWMLESDGNATATLVSEGTWGDFEFQLDWRRVEGSTRAPVILIGRKAVRLPLVTESKGIGPDGWNRSVIRLEGESLVVRHNGGPPERQSVSKVSPDKGTIGLAGDGGGVQFANLFIRPLSD